MTIIRTGIIKRPNNPEVVLNEFLKRNPKWEATSISHNIHPDWVSVYMVLKQTQPLEAGDGLPGSLTETEG